MGYGAGYFPEGGDNGISSVSGGGSSSIETAAGSGFATLIGSANEPTFAGLSLSAESDTSANCSISSFKDANLYADYTSYHDGSVAEAQIDVKDAGQQTTLNVGADGVKIVNVGSKPAAAEAYRGRIWVTLGAPSAADVIEICLKSAGDTYSWVNIATG